jgi:hypothetical protein
LIGMIIAILVVKKLFLNKWITRRSNGSY